MKSYLKLNRLAIFKQGEKLYDQKFHNGVNIIHGSNGSGKSTIADFIFYALGGDLREWREYAGLTEFVIAELTVSEGILTVRRDVSVTGLLT
jgi:DNA repair exonuclease SbcCD ATPase subunit